MRLTLAVAAGLVLAVGACGGESAPQTTRASTPAAAAQAQAQAQPGCPAAGRQDVDGGDGFLRMPAGAKAGATPLLVVVIPGGQGDPDDRLGVGRAANRAGFGVLYPTSEHGGFWTLNDAQGRGDVDDVRDLLDRVAATGCFDARRISITGVSNGAGFSARMACELPDRFAAVVPVAAGYRALDRCPAAARASFLAIHGTGDTVVPYNGKKPDRKGDVPRYTAGWAGRDGCSSPPRRSSPQRLVARLRYRGCDAGLKVELLRLAGTEHGWPGSTGPRRPVNPSGLEAAREVLRFVGDARRPAD